MKGTVLRSLLLGGACQDRVLHTLDLDKLRGTTRGIFGSSTLKLM